VDLVRFGTLLADTLTADGHSARTAATHTWMLRGFHEDLTT
jgi:hypothetical protein